MILLRPILRTLLQNWPCLYIFLLRSQIQEKRRKRRPHGSRRELPPHRRLSSLGGADKGTRRTLPALRSTCGALGDLPSHPRLPKVPLLRKSEEKGNKTQAPTQGCSRAKGSSQSPGVGVGTCICLHPWHPHPALSALSHLCPPCSQPEAQVLGKSCPYFPAGSQPGKKKNPASSPYKGREYSVQESQAP